MCWTFGKRGRSKLYFEVFLSLTTVTNEVCAEVTVGEICHKGNNLPQWRRRQELARGNDEGWGAVQELYIDGTTHLNGAGIHIAQRDLYHIVWIDIACCIRLGLVGVANVDFIFWHRVWSTEPVTFEPFFDVPPFWNSFILQATLYSDLLLHVFGRTFFYPSSLSWYFIPCINFGRIIRLSWRDLWVCCSLLISSSIFCLTM